MNYELKLLDENPSLGNQKTQLERPMGVGIDFICIVKVRAFHLSMARGQFYIIIIIFKCTICCGLIRL